MKQQTTNKKTTNRPKTNLKQNKKKKRETYIGLFNFSCYPKSPRATSLYPQSF